MDEMDEYRMHESRIPRLHALLFSGVKECKPYVKHDDISITLE